MKTCIFQTLTRNDLIAIEDKFPNLHDSFIKHMSKYNDEYMVQRRQFIGNIPYLRGLDTHILDRIVYLMKE